MSEIDPVTMVAAASLDIRLAAAETMRHAGARYERFSADLVTRTACLAVAGWAAAVNGDDATLAAIAQPDAARWLRHLVRQPVLIAPGPRVTTIEIWALDADTEPALLRVKFEFTGRHADGFRPVAVVIRPRPDARRATLTQVRDAGICRHSHFLSSGRPRTPAAGAGGRPGH